MGSAGQSVSSLSKPSTDATLNSRNTKVTVHPRTAESSQQRSTYSRYGDLGLYYDAMELLNTRL